MHMPILVTDFSFFQFLDLVKKPNFSEFNVMSRMPLAYYSSGWSPCTGQRTPKTSPAPEAVVPSWRNPDLAQST